MTPLFLYEMAGHGVECLPRDFHLAQDIVDRFLKMPSQVADLLVLGFQVSHASRRLWIARLKLPKNQVLFGMMAALRKPGEVPRDPRNDVVVRRLGRVKKGQLVLQGVQQFGDVPVLPLEPVHGF